MKIPRFYRWNNNWSFGWETGEDNDLICIKPDISIKIEGDIYLSPVCSNRLLAFLAFVLKQILSRIDHNLRGLK